METKAPKCRRCESCLVYIILDKVHVECRNCFLESCNKKVRAAIGKTKLVRNNDPILIAYSGGPSSLALLDLIKNSIDSDFRREQKFRPSILHIDTQSVINRDRQLHEFLAERREMLSRLLKRLFETCQGWPIYWSTLETCMVDESFGRIFVKFEGTLENGNHLLSNEDSHMAFHKSVAEAGDLTDQQQFVADKNVEFLARLAERINQSLEQDQDRAKFLFTGSTATQLSNDLLVDVILGRGATIRSTVAICDSTYSVPIMRPMRDFSKKEVAYYLRARELNPPVQPDLLTMADRRASIQTATESFLTKLYVDYPATYSTLLKTGNKMQD